LVGLGYTQDLSKKALQTNKWDLDATKNWLMANNRQTIATFGRPANLSKPNVVSPRSTVLSPKNQYEFTIDKEVESALASLDSLPKNLPRRDKLQSVPVLPMDQSNKQKNSRSRSPSPSPIAATSPTPSSATVQMSPDTDSDKIDKSSQSARNRKKSAPVGNNRKIHRNKSEPDAKLSPKKKEVNITPTSTTANWNCIKCKQTNKPESVKCYMCGNPFLSQEQIREVDDTKKREELEKKLQVTDKWICESCNVKNEKHLEKCNMCGSSRPPSASDDDKSGYSSMSRNSGFGSKGRKKITHQKDANIQLPY